MGEIPRVLFEFLLTVDEPAKEHEFVIRTARALLLNDVRDQADLIGFDVADCAKGLWSFENVLFMHLCSAMWFQVQFPAEE